MTAWLIGMSALPGLAQTPAFAGAEGFGAYATGGRGGDVYYVRNLNSSGAGSLRYGVETAPSSGRTIVFAVSGYIPINYNSDTGNQTVRIVQNKVTTPAASAAACSVCPGRPAKAGGYRCRPTAWPRG